MILLLAFLAGLVCVRLFADEKSDQWTAETLKLISSILDIAKEDGVLPPDFRMRIAFHPSAEPKILGGVEGAPDLLVITRGFIVLAERVGLRQDEYEVLLAHEVGHMMLNHKFNATGRELERQELAADSFVRRRFGTNSACQLAHALHRLAEPFGGWPAGSLEKKRELFNMELCEMIAEKSKSGSRRSLREQ
jgi:hypothetical protein